MMYMIIEYVNNELPWKKSYRDLDDIEIVRRKSRATPENICNNKAHVFRDILELIYNYEWSS